MSKNVLAWQAASVARTPILPQGGSIVERAPQPVAHVTRQKRLAELLAIGDTIWLVGRYAKLSHASVSLIGRIVIAKKTLKDGAVTFLASRESHRLPWNNASLVLGSVELNSRHGPVFLSPSVGIAQQLQTTREIASGSKELIERFSADLKARPSVFINYNWTATTDILPVLLPALSEAGFAIWVDRWSGPRRIKDGKIFQPPDLITKLIADAIVSSDLVVALVSDEYEASRWTSLGRHWKVPLLGKTISRPFGCLSLKSEGIFRQELSDHTWRNPCLPLERHHCDTDCNARCFAHLVTRFSAFLDVCSQYSISIAIAFLRFFGSRSGGCPLGFAKGSKWRIQSQYCPANELASKSRFLPI